LIPLDSAKAIVEPWLNKKLAPTHRNVLDPAGFSISNIERLHDVAESRAVISRKRQDIET